MLVSRRSRRGKTSPLPMGQVRACSWCRWGLEKFWTPFLPLHVALLDRKVPPRGKHHATCDTRHVMSDTPESGKNRSFLRGIGDGTY
jgi:hypothetical protein